MATGSKTYLFTCQDPGGRVAWERADLAAALRDAAGHGALESEGVAA